MEMQGDWESLENRQDKLEDGIADGIFGAAKAAAAPVRTTGADAAACGDPSTLGSHRPRPAEAGRATQAVTRSRAVVGWRWGHNTNQVSQEVGDAKRFVSSTSLPLQIPPRSERL